MSLIKENIKSLLRVEKDLPRIAKKAVVENMDFIMFLLKEDQLGNSIRSDGKPAPYYAPTTIEYARFDPPRTGVSSKSDSDRYNFEWSGKWMDGMYIKVDDDGFDILSRDGKTAILEKMARGKLTKLTEKNNKKVNDEVIEPELYERLFERLLNF